MRAKVVSSSSTVTNTASTAQSEILKHGLELQTKFNTMCAFEYLRFRNIDTEIIERTLFAAIAPSNNVPH